MRKRILTVAGLAFGGCLVACAATQQIVLEAGWNLVSVQVGLAPWTVADIEEAIDAPNVLKAIWGYDAAANEWKTCQPMMEGFPDNLAEIRPGHGYWVNVTDACVLTLHGEPWDGAVVLRPGWNLVGFPGLAASNLASFFGNALVNVQQVWGFEGGSVQKFKGYDVSSVPQRKDISEIAPSRGYWVYALEAVTLAAQPEILLTGDVDMPPLQAQRNYVGEHPAYIGRKVKLAGVEDIAADLNGNGILDDAETQDTIVFGVGVQRQPVIIGNRGTGALNWSITENCPWLSIEGDASGTVAGASAYVYLEANRKGMTTGTYTNSSVVVTAGGVSKPVTVIMDVASVDGDFKGYASATHVNGKEIPLGKVDMGLNVFVTTNTSAGTRFKAVIDNDNSLLFPRDVFMNGVFYLGNSFSLTTSFSMPAGDRNEPPYDTFSHVDNDPKDVKDKDHNQNGKLDVENPFPFPIRRSVTLLGSRTDENTLEGSYIETIVGALPNDEKISVEGSFLLKRQNYKPTRRSIYTARDTEDQVIGQRNESFRRIITISEAVNINGVTSTLNIDFPRPEALTITLTSPQGTVATLHNRGSVLASIAELSDFDGENGSGDWVLDIIWDANGGERGRYWSWSLNLGGIATYNVSGRLVDENGNPVSGATVSLSGSNEIGSHTTDANGYFTLTGLTENDYNLSVTMPGYQTATSAFLIESGDVDLDVIRVSPLALSGLTGIKATPSVGYAPLDVQFVVGIGTTDDAEIAAVDWTVTRTEIDSYDSTNVIVMATNIVGNAAQSGAKPWMLSQHFDSSVREYRVEATVTETSGRQTTFTYGPIGLAQVQMNALDTPFGFSNCGFIGGGSGVDIDADVKTAVGMIWMPDVRYEQQKRDCAAFDINRWPTNTFDVTKEDTDFFVQPNTPYYRPNSQDDGRHALCDKKYDEYLPPPGGADRFRLITTMGGCVFGTAPAQSGGWMLQTGRIEE